MPPLSLPLMNQCIFSTRPSVLVPSIPRSSTGFHDNRLEEALGFEIDSHYSQPASLIWKNTGLNLKHADFTLEEPSPRFNLVICNPPYVRHHHIQASDKERLLCRSFNASGMKLSGLAGSTAISWPFPMPG